MRHAHGGVRDFCIGIQFVTADGKLAKGGGRVVKNVAGYDMMKLLIGSFGTLGIIVGANFKVFPRPAQTREFIAEFGSPEEAIAFRDRVLASPLTPMCLDIVSPRAAEYLPHVGASVPWRVLVRAGGSDAVLARYRAELGSAIVREVQGADEEDDWRRLADFDETVLARHHNAMVVRVGRWPLPSAPPPITTSCAPPWAAPASGPSSWLSSPSRWTRPRPCSTPTPSRSCAARCPRVRLPS
jgi:FAD/FMN-containing dehydrogenase